MSAVYRRAIIALVILIVVWAYSWIIMKQMLTYIDPFDFAALRYLGGAIVLFVYLLLSRKSLRPPPLLPTLVVGLAQTAAFQGLAQWALITGSAGKVALFCYTMPFWAVPLAYWCLKDKPSKKQYLGSVFAAVGLLLFIAPWHNQGNYLSIILATLGGLTWAIGTVLSKKLFSKVSIDLINFTAWQMFLGALILCMIALVVPSKPIEWSGFFIYGLLYSVLFASSFAWVLWIYIVRVLPTSVASLSSLLVPIGAIFLAWLMLNDTPTFFELLAIALIIIGLVIVRPQKVIPS